jgi:hypothetical protein
MVQPYGDSLNFSYQCGRFRKSGHDQGDEATQIYEHIREYLDDIIRYSSLYDESERKL